MIRRVQVTRLRPELADEYERLHRAVWPAVEARIRASNIRNYTIALHGDDLIAYWEYHGEDLPNDLEAIASDPITQEWWKLTDPCQVPPDDAMSSPWADARELWHLD